MTMVTIKCEHCGEVGQTAEGNAGGRVECPRCGRVTWAVRAGYWDRVAVESPCLRWWWLGPGCLMLVLTLERLVPWWVGAGSAVVLAGVEWLRRRG